MKKRALLRLGLFFVLCAVCCMIGRGVVVIGARKIASEREYRAHKIVANIHDSGDVSALNDLVELITLPVELPLSQVTNKTRWAANLVGFKSGAQAYEEAEKNKQTFALWYARVYSYTKMQKSIGMTPVPITKAKLDKITVLAGAKVMDRYAGIIGLLNIGFAIFVLLSVLLLALGLKPSRKKKIVLDAQSIAEDTVTEKPAGGNDET